MKKIFVALSMVALLAACSGEGGNSTNPSDDESATLSSADGQGSSSSSRHCEECNDEAISSDSNAESNGSSRSSSSEKNAESSSSENLSESSSSSAGKAKSSSSVVTLATPCKTETEDNCEYGTVLDDRDGQTYKTVTIGIQTWMAENLNYAYTGVPYNYSGNTSDSTSWCYDNDPANCAKYGRLYTWAAAIDSVKLATDAENPLDCGYEKECGLAGKVQGICPEGWHLPDTTEWKTLFTAVGGSSTAGAKLKSQTGWTAYDGITNEDSFGFSALPAGFRFDYGHYINEGDYAYFWSSTEYSSYGAYYVSLDYNGDYAYLGNDGKSNGFSVRCVKD